MSDILSQIDEEVRREKTLALWKKYAPLLGLVAVIALVGAGGYGLWRNQQEEKLTTASASIMNALQTLTATTRPATIEALQSAATKDAQPLAWMAELFAAGLLSDEGKHAEAATAYDKIAATSQTPPLYRDLALLLAAENRLAIAEAPVEDIKTALTPLAAPGKPWRNPARELLGVIQLRGGDVAAARQWFEAVQADPETPATQRARMAQVLASLK